MSKRLVCVVLICLFASQLVLAKDMKATYFGGTVADFKDSKDPIEGTLIISDETAMKYIATDKKFVGKSLEIPYKDFIDLEYGQKAGRRVGAAAASFVLLGPVGLLFLLSKKRKHYLTIGYKDKDGKEQAVILQIDKNDIRETLTVIQARSGKKVTYQDDEAKKSGSGN